MSIVKYASAGTIESSDVFVEIEPGSDGIKIELESVVQKQFGERITKAISDVLCEQNIKNAVVRVKDRGALECVIRARVETAVHRGKGEF